VDVDRDGTSTATEPLDVMFLKRAKQLEKARASTAGIPRVELETLDLIDPDSVDAFAQRFLDSRRQCAVSVDRKALSDPSARDAVVDVRSPA
jgi:hypothetical protein